MTPILSIRRAVILLALLAFTTSAYGQGVTLRYRWAKGDTLTYRVVMQTTSVVTGMPGMGEMKIDQGVTQVVKITALDVAKGRIRDNTMKTEMPSTVSMQGQDGSMMNMQNRTTTTVKMTLVEK
jgi:hypothetical protein